MTLPLSLLPPLELPLHMSRQLLRLLADRFVAALNRFYNSLPPLSLLFSLQKWAT